MTENQKRRITLMRNNHVGYAAIANELKISLNTVKAFCRRNGLMTSHLVSDTQPENKVTSSPDIDLISSKTRGNTTPIKRTGSLGNTGFSDDHPVCEVTVSYADEPDLGTVADVLELLTHASYGR